MTKNILGSISIGPVFVLRQNTAPMVVSLEISQANRGAEK